MRKRTLTSISLSATVALVIASAGTTPATAVSTMEPTGAGALFSGGCTVTGTRAGSPATLRGYTYLDAGSDRIRAVPDRTWASGCAVRVEVHQGDFDSDSTDRAELTAAKTLWYPGQDVWYALSFNLARPLALPPAGDWMLVHQFFAQDLVSGISGGSPPLALEITPQGAIVVDVRGGEKQSAYDRAPRDNGYVLGPASPGRWHDLLLHVHWSAGSDGLVEVWQQRANGSFTRHPQVSAPGPDVLTVSGEQLPVYAETGIYRTRTSAVQVVYYGGLWARPTRQQALAFFARTLSPWA